MSREVGGAFSLFGGSVVGKTTELDPPKRIVQDWRFNNWDEGVFSKVRGAMLAALWLVNVLPGRECLVDARKVQQLG